MRYRADIDGLRALAVVAVIAYHAHLPRLGGGFVGVDVFFVISGYLIGSILYRGLLDGSFRFAEFYARRARRILPALLVVLLVCSVLALCLLTPMELSDFSSGAVATAFAVSNIAYWWGGNYFSPSADFNPLLMTWTLGVEEQFYLVAPVALLLVLRWLPRFAFAVVAAACALSLAFSIWGTIAHPTATFFLLPARAWELGAGMLLAMHEIARPGAMPKPGSRLADGFGVVGLLLLAFAITRFNKFTPFPGIAALVPVAGALFVLLGRGSWTNRVVLSSPPVVFVGLVSYSWYLWHWPLLSFTRIASASGIRHGAIAAAVGLSFVLAVLSWKFVEQPFRARRLPAGGTLLRYGGAVAMVAVAMAALGMFGGWPQRFDPELVQLEQATRARSGKSCFVAFGSDRPNETPSCVPPAGAGQAVALLGDSHAASLGTALRQRAESQGYLFLQLNRAACPPLIGVTHRVPAIPTQEADCAAYNERALQIVLGRLDVSIVILGGAWNHPFLEPKGGGRYVPTDRLGAEVSPEESVANFRAGLNDTVSALQNAGKRVIVMGDVARFRFDPPQHLASAFIPARRVLASLASTPVGKADRWVDRAGIFPDAGGSEDIIRSIVAAHPGAVSIDLVAPFCDAERCVFSVPGAIFYRDSNHLSQQGAELALRSFRF